MKTAGIIGLGLIGGSLAKSLKQRAGFTRIVAFDLCADSLAAAHKDGVADVCADAADARFSSCDIVFICTPVAQVAPYAKAVAPFLREGAIVTDVGSTKASIMAAMADAPYFIGGHPMAGSERYGYGASRGDLFHGARYVLCLGPRVPPHLPAAMAALVEQIGARPLVMDAALHDRAAAAVSHVPHVVAAALANTAAALEDEAGAFRMLAAGGFRDMTRIASSDPALWDGIAADNRSEILRVLRQFKTEISAFETAMASSGTLPLFRRAKAYKDTMP